MKIIFLNISVTGRKDITTYRGIYFLDVILSVNYIEFISGNERIRIFQRNLLIQN